MLGITTAVHAVAMYTSRLMGASCKLPMTNLLVFFALQKKVAMVLLSVL